METSAGSSKAGIEADVPRAKDLDYKWAGSFSADGDRGGAITSFAGRARLGRGLAALVITLPLQAACAASANFFRDPAIFTKKIKIRK